MILIAVVAPVSGMRRASAQSPAMPDPQAALAEARRLDTQAEQLQSQGRFAEAVPPAEQCLSIREKELGPMHPEVAASLFRLGDLRWALSEYATALPLLLRALQIREKVFGPSHPDVAAVLNDLAVVYKATGEYGKALPLYLRAVQIREKALGTMHPDVAESLSNLALLYLEQGAYAKAKPALVRAIQIREKAGGLMDPGLSRLLNNLSGVYSEQGAFTTAEPLLVRALEIDEKALGPTHPHLANSLSNLAHVYLSLGAYDKAESLSVRALQIRESALGPMHLAVAVSLNNLAMLYYTRGALEKAEPLYLRAMAIWEKALGKTHPKIATALNNLASLYGDQGAYDKAESLHLRAIDIIEKTLGPTHSSVSTSLNNLGWLYMEQGAYRKAEPLFLRAIEIWEKSVGSMHPGLAASMSNLADAYTYQGAYGKAEPLYLRALGIDERVLGSMHPEVAKSLVVLAGLYRSQGAHDQALPLLSRAAELREAELRRELGRLSEPRRRALMTTLRDETASVVSFHVDAEPTSSRALDLALTTVLRRKGRILDSLAETQATLRDHLTPKLRGQLDQLAQARTELSERISSPPDPHRVAERAAAIAASRNRVEALEAALGTASLEFRAQSAPITVAKVQAALAVGAMLVEFVRYRPFVRGRVEQRLQPDRYVAYLVTRQGPPRWVALGDAAPIDAAIEAALAALHAAPGAQAGNAALRALDERVFAPIRAQLAGISHVIVAPDSKLNLVPFEALVDAQGHYELEQRLISYVTSGRDLVRLAAPHMPRSPAVIVASPDYGPRPVHAAPGAGFFAPLPGAAAEVDELQSFFSAAPLTGPAASKRALAALAGPAILHIATHGFYTREAAASAPATASTAVATAPPVERGLVFHGAPAPPQSRPDDPIDALDHAGLAMAGANQGAAGIVTAREIAGFDWWGTQLVVLSACETGVGPVPSGDGVYGLRRAVVLAGAEAQVVSLWNVNDSSARELMRAYYDELFRGTGRAEALRRAKLRLLQQPRYAHPYYWASFILAGDWTPLHGVTR
jgi:tetratricopeptide (TPR) repeat protein